MGDLGVCGCRNLTREVNCIGDTMLMIFLAFSPVEGRVVQYFAYPRVIAPADTEGEVGLRSVWISWQARASSCDFSAADKGSGNVFSRDGCGSTTAGCGLRGTQRESLHCVSEETGARGLGLSCREGFRETRVAPGPD